MALSPKVAVGISIFGVIVALIAFGIHRSQQSHSRGDDTTFGISPDGRRIVFDGRGVGDRDLYIFDLNTKKVSQVAATVDYETAPQFSPDGKSIVYANGQPGIRADHLFVRNLESGAVRQVTFGDANACSPMFTADGKRIVFARDTHYNWGGLAASWSGGGAVWSVGVDGSRPTRLLPESVLTASPRISHDGKSLVWWGMSKDLNSSSVFTSPVNSTSDPVSIVSGYPRDVEFSPLGDQVVYADGEFGGTGKLCVIPVRGGAPRMLSAAGKGCTHPVFSPDGRMIYYLLNGYDDNKNGLWKIDTDGTNPTKIAGSNLFDSPLTWSPGPISQSISVRRTNSHRNNTDKGYASRGHDADVKKR